jgi:hypothetical protein
MCLQICPDTEKDTYEVETSSRFRFLREISRDVDVARFNIVDSIGESWLTKRRTKLRSAFPKSRTWCCGWGVNRKKKWAR